MLPKYNFKCKYQYINFRGYGGCHIHSILYILLWLNKSKYIDFCGWIFQYKLAKMIILYMVTLDCYKYTYDWSNPSVSMSNMVLRPIFKM